MYTTKKTAPEKNSPFNLHEQDQGAPLVVCPTPNSKVGQKRYGLIHTESRTKISLG